MRLNFALLVTGLVVACTPVASPPAPTNTPQAEAPPPVLTILASFEAPAFLENLLIEPDGSIIFTNYTGKSLHRIGPGGTLSVLANLDVHPVSLIQLGDTYLVAAHATPFTSGPEFIGSGQLLSLSAEGDVLSRRPVPEAGFLNGMVASPGGKVLIADSAKAQILAYDSAAGGVHAWFSDAPLAPQTDPYFLPGANGLKFEGDDLLVSSSANRTIYRLRISADGTPEGPLQPLATDLPGTDDFAVLDEGGYVTSTHADRVVRIFPGGEIETLTADPRIKGNTAVAVRGKGEDRTLIILGTGGLSEGLSEPGVVMELPFSE